MLADHERSRRRREERVAIRVRPGDGFGTHVQCGTRLVLDDDGLSPSSSKVVAENARQRVRRRPRRKRYDNLDGAVRIVVLCGRRSWRCDKAYHKNTIPETR